MSGDSNRGESASNGGVSRRRALRWAAGGGALASGGFVIASAGDDSGRFPPDDTTTFGDAVRLGSGELRPFTTVGPAGKPRYHGVEIDRAVVTGSLPGAAALADDRRSDDPKHDDKYSPVGRALEVHRQESLSFFVPFPDADGTPVTFLGFNWNPEGHPGADGAWQRPHFDVHFHLLPTDVVDAIEGPAPAPYDSISDEKLPAGYSRSPPAAADERYITDMGEHLAPADAPEVPGDPDAFTNTLIQGFVGVDGEPRLAFLEPMLTREFLRQLDGTERYDVPQPSVYPHDTQHPTAYSVRADGDDTVVVALEEFEPV